MTRMTGPDCAVMCNLINTHTHTHTRTNVELPDRLMEPSRTSLVSFIMKYQYFFGGASARCSAAKNGATSTAGRGQGKVSDGRSRIDTTNGFDLPVARGYFLLSRVVGDKGGVLQNLRMTAPLQLHVEGRGCRAAETLRLLLRFLSRFGSRWPILVWC